MFAQCEVEPKLKADNVSGSERTTRKQRKDRTKFRRCVRVEDPQRLLHQCQR